MLFMKLASKHKQIITIYLILYDTNWSENVMLFFGIQKLYARLS